MRHCDKCKRLFIQPPDERNLWCPPCLKKINTPTKIYATKPGSYNIWYTKPKAARRRDRGKHIETDDLLLQHNLSIRVAWTEEDQQLWSVNASWMAEIPHPASVICANCDLIAEFKTEPEAEYAYKQLQKEVCRTRQKDALTSALESLL